VGFAKETSHPGLPVLLASRSEVGTGKSGLILVLEQGEFPDSGQGCTISALVFPGPLLFSIFGSAGIYIRELPKLGLNEDEKYLTYVLHCRFEWIGDARYLVPFTTD
jgi:hypothetical protein